MMEGSSGDQSRHDYDAKRRDTAAQRNSQAGTITLSLTALSSPSPSLLDTSHPTSHRKNIFRRTRDALRAKAQPIHDKIPYLRRLPLSAISIILLLVLINLVAWAICGLILTRHSSLLGTAALAYSLGLRHALDADHISAIDLMTRRLIASGQTPVTVGTFFSLGHSTIVIITSVVVAATAAGISDRFGGFGNVGGIIGTSVSAVFLILLGLMNAYILYKLLLQLRKVIHLQPEDELSEGFKVEGGGVLFRILKRLFKLIDRPWKMYPLGVLFGLGFDTSSEVALLGISSIQGAKGTSIWLILIFPALFTVGMCLIDTIDGALMMSLYMAPAKAEGIEDDKKKMSNYNNSGDTQQQNNESNHFMTGNEAAEVDAPNTVNLVSSEARPEVSQTATAPPLANETQNLRVKSPLTFLYYSSILTLLTVMVALIIGTIQLLSLIRHIAISDEEAGQSRFWHGVDAAGDNYDIIGAVICAAFIVFGGASVLCYRPFRRWVEGVRINDQLNLRRGGIEPRETGVVELVDDEQQHVTRDEGEDSGYHGPSAEGSRNGQTGMKSAVTRRDGKGVMVVSGEYDYERD